MTSWLRLGCVAVLWALLPVTEPTERGRVAAELVVVTVGVVLAHVHARPELIERLERVPRTSWLVSQLTGNRGVAKANLAGLFEGSGILIAATLYGGWWAVPGYSTDALIIAMIAVVLFAWSAFLSVVLDAGFYAPAAVVVLGNEESAGPPPRIFRWVRHSIPPGLTLIGLVLFVPPWTPELASIPISIRVALALSFLTLRLVWLGFDQVLGASADTVADAESVVRMGAVQDLHSLAKNSITSILNAVEAPNYKRNEVRSLIRNALVYLEEIRLSWLNPNVSDAPRTLDELWEATLAVMSTLWRDNCTFDMKAAPLRLGSTDWQLTRRLLSDLVVNALKAEAKHVHTGVAVLPGGRYPWIELHVRDDGPGMPSGVLDNPRTSLAVLAWEVARFSGTLTFSAAENGSGTTVRARWRSPYPTDHPFQPTMKE